MPARSTTTRPSSPAPRPIGASSRPSTASTPDRSTGTATAAWGSREAAEDATSTVFARALASLPRYRDRSFRGWLFTIAHRVVADHYRSARPAVPLAAAAAVADAAASPEEAACTAEAGGTIRALLARLPEDQRRLMELRLAGLTGAEIARVLGRSHGAVRSSQHRVLVRLRTILGLDARPGGGRDAGA